MSQIRILKTSGEKRVKNYVHAGENLFERTLTGNFLNQKKTEHGGKRQINGRISQTGLMRS